jgi:WD40 repeat protein
MHFFNPIGSKATVCAFAGTGPEMIVTGHESGKVALFEAAKGEEVDSNERAHGETVTDLQMSPDRTYFITSSKDKSARARPFPSHRHTGALLTHRRYMRRRRCACSRRSRRRRR